MAVRWWVRLATLGTLTRAAEGGVIARGGDTASRENCHILTLPGSLLQQPMTRKWHYSDTLPVKFSFCDIYQYMVNPAHPTTAAMVIQIITITGGRTW